MHELTHSCTCTGTPFRFRYWIAQCGVYLLVMLLEKLLVGPLVLFNFWKKVLLTPSLTHSLAHSSNTIIKAVYMYNTQSKNEGVVKVHSQLAQGHDHSLTLTHTHSLTHSHIHTPLTHSLTHSLTHALTHSYTLHSLTHSLTHSLAHSLHSPTHALTRLLTHSLIHSLAHAHTCTHRRLATSFPSIIL